MKHRNTENQISKPILGLIAGVIMLLTALPVNAITRVRDVARPLGERTNALLGYGLVFGLNGTGDGGDSLVTMRPLIAMLGEMGNPVSVQDLGSGKNVAYVMLTAEIGRNGVRSGDQLDVQVHSVYNAKSLAGGTVIGILGGGGKFDKNFYGMVNGNIELPDANIPTNGVIKNGATMERDVIYEFWNEDFKTGEASFTLVLDDRHANFQMAKRVQMEINEEFAPTGAGLNAGQQQATTHASIIGPKNIHITIPAKQAKQVPMVIARILDLPMEFPDPDALVVINKRTKSVVITGNVELSPVSVLVDGITVQVPAPGDNGNDPQQLAGQEDTPIYLSDLIAALDALNAPFDSKVNAIHEINNANCLRARLKIQ